MLLLLTCRSPNKVINSYSTSDITNVNSRLTFKTTQEEFFLKSIGRSKYLDESLLEEVEFVDNYLYKILVDVTTSASLKNGEDNYYYRLSESINNNEIDSSIGEKICCTINTINFIRQDTLYKRVPIIIEIQPAPCNY